MKTYFMLTSVYRQGKLQCGSQEDEMGQALRKYHPCIWRPYGNMEKKILYVPF